MEAPPGFEPGYEGFAVPCLTNLATVPWGGAKYRDCAATSSERQSGQKPPGAGASGSQYPASPGSAESIVQR